MTEHMTAAELEAETPTDRAVRLALAAGRYKRERDEARAQVAAVEALHSPYKLHPAEPDSLDLCAGCRTSQTSTYWSKCRTRAALAGALDHPPVVAREAAQEGTS